MPQNPEDVERDTAHLTLMRLLNERPASSQREISRQLGWSLGKAHYLVHALLEKGWIKAGNFRRSKNKMSYAYLLTPKGVRQKLRLTRRFLGRKEEEFELLQQEIALLRRELSLRESKPADSADGR